MTIDNQLDHEAIAGLAFSEMPLGLLVDLLAFSSGATVNDQQGILASSSLIARGNHLISILQNRLAEQQASLETRFPPEFSYN